MANTIIQLKHSTVTGNVPSSLANGEISINSRDGKLFYSTPLGVVTAFNPYPGPAGLDTEIQFNDSGSLGGSEKLTFNKTTGLLTVNGTVRANIFSDDGTDLLVFANSAFNKANSALSNTNLQASGTLRLLNQGGDEGGELFLDKPVTNTSLAAGITIDIFQNKLRFFETGGSVRGVFIDMANGASAGVGTDLLNPASAPDAVARATASAAFNSANLIQTYVTSANANISLLQTYVTTANANIATILATNTTQNTNITAAFSQANAAYTRANNSLNANTGGTVTGDITATSFITTGAFGNITGANTVYANNFVANTGFIQFSDGSKQYTANAGGGTTDTFARNQANAAFAYANTISAGSVDTFARNQANAAFSAANTAQSTATSAQGTASSAASDASFALSTACTAQTSATTANDTATSAFIQANAAFIKANTGTGNASFADYFPTGDWGNFTDAVSSAFGEDLTVVYDCRVDPITPRGYLLSKDFGYVA